MSNIVITSDSTCDLSPELRQRYNVTTLPLGVTLGGKVYKDGVDITPDDIYAHHDKTGELPKTTAANVDEFYNFFKDFVDEGKTVIHFDISSKMSSTFNNARIAAEELAEEYPGRKMIVVDTLCASLGQGMFCYLVVQKQREGASLEEIRTYAEELVPHLAHWFTVDDLHFLKRGGRISGATAVVGSLLQIKPVLHVDDEGHLISVSKARGRKAAIQALANKVAEDAIEPEKQVMFISHGDCVEDAEFLASILKEKFHVPQIHINHVGPVIGSHAGPGVLAMFYVGSKR